MIVTKSVNQESATKALAQKANGENKLQKGRTIRDLLERMKPEIARALPRHVDADRLTRVAMTAIRGNPQLLQASQDSLLAAVMQCAQLGLEPGILGHVYLVPFRNRKRGTTEVQFILGYRGMVELARRSGNIESIAAHEVCEHDEFEFEFGLNERLRHVPALTGRGSIVLFYAYAKFSGGGHQIHVMSREQVDAIRRRTKAMDGPWATDYIEMGRKTVLRNLCKYLPISIEIMRDIEQDETSKAELGGAEDEDMDALDVTFEDVSEGGAEDVDNDPSSESPPEQDESAESQNDAQLL